MRQFKFFPTLSSSRTIATFPRDNTTVALCHECQTLFRGFPTPYVTHFCTGPVDDPDDWIERTYKDPIHFSTDEEPIH